MKIEVTMGKIIQRIKMNKHSVILIKRICNGSMESLFLSKNISFVIILLSLMKIQPSNQPTPEGKWLIIPSNLFNPFHSKTFNKRLRSRFKLFFIHSKRMYKIMVSE